MAAGKLGGCRCVVPYSAFGCGESGSCMNIKFLKIAIGRIQLEAFASFIVYRMLLLSSDMCLSTCCVPCSRPCHLECKVFMPDVFVVVFHSTSTPIVAVESSLQLGYAHRSMAVKRHRGLMAWIVATVVLLLSLLALSLTLLLFLFLYLIKPRMSLPS